MRQEIPLTAGFYVSNSLPISHQECTNFFPVVQQQSALSARQLLGSSGIRPTEDYSYNSGDMAPNPGFAPGLVLSKYKKDQYSGGR